MYSARLVNARSQQGWLEARPGWSANDAQREPSSGNPRPICRHVDGSVPVCDGSEQQAACHRSVRGAMADEAELAVGGLVVVVAMTLCT